MADNPNDLTGAFLDQLHSAEGAPGVYKPLNECDDESLMGAGEGMLVKARIVDEINALAVEAVSCGITLPSEWATRDHESVASLQALRDEIADVIEKGGV